MPLYEKMVVIPEGKYRELKTKSESPHFVDSIAGNVEGGMVNHIELGEHSRVTVKPNGGLTASTAQKKINGKAPRPPPPPGGLPPGQPPDGPAPPGAALPPPPAGPAGPPNTPSLTITPPARRPQPEQDILPEIPSAPQTPDSIILPSPKRKRRFFPADDNDEGENDNNEEAIRRLYFTRGTNTDTAKTIDFGSQFENKRSTADAQVGTQRTMTTDAQVGTQRIRSADAQVGTQRARASDAQVGTRPLILSKSQLEQINIAPTGTRPKTQRPQQRQQPQDLQWRQPRALITEPEDDMEEDAALPANWLVEPNYSSRPVLRQPVLNAPAVAIQAGEEEPLPPLPAPSALPAITNNVVPLLALPAPEDVERRLQEDDQVMPEAVREEEEEREEAPQSSSSSSSNKRSERKGPTFVTKKFGRQVPYPTGQRAAKLRKSAPVVLAQDLQNMIADRVNRLQGRRTRMGTAAAAAAATPSRPVLQVKVPKDTEEIVNVMVRDKARKLQRQEPASTDDDLIGYDSGHEAIYSEGVSKRRKRERAMRGPPEKKNKVEKRKKKKGDDEDDPKVLT